MKMSVRLGTGSLAGLVALACGSPRGPRLLTAPEASSGPGPGYPSAPQPPAPSLPEGNGMKRDTSCPALQFFHPKP